jgi:DNA helicase HerA-like ATPase
VRSKGVGVYFVTQNPADIPDAVLAQLGNRVQHALRAYTPREQKAVRVAAETFRPNPDFSTEEVITQLATGEALVSVLEEKGIPSVVGRTMMRPPSSRLGPISPEERRTLIANSPVAGLYDAAVDRESAFEVLSTRARKQQEQVAQQRLEDEQLKAEAAQVKAERAAAPRRSTRQTPTEAAISSFTRTIANRLGSALVRGILGGLKRGR